MVRDMVDEYEADDFSVVVTPRASRSDWCNLRSVAFHCPRRLATLRAGESCCSPGRDLIGSSRISLFTTIQSSNAHRTAETHLRHIGRPRNDTSGRAPGAP
jgi:hypothetical protein